MTVSYYNTANTDRIRATESFQDTLIRQAYLQGHKSNKVDIKQKNHPVSQAMFDQKIADKMPRLATCMTGVETVGYAQKKILVIASPEMIGFMYEHGISRSRMDFLGLPNQKWQEDLAMQQGIDRSRIQMLQSKKGQSVKKDIEEHIKKTVTQSKYDMVIMNPPWELTADFRALARALTKPDGVIGCIADAKSAQDLDWDRISEFEYTDASFKGVKLNAVVTVEHKRQVTETLIKDMQGNSISIDPTQIATPPKLDLTQWKPANDVVKQIRSGKLLGYDQISHGTLKGREVILDAKGVEVVGYKVIEKGVIKYRTAPGDAGKPVPTIRVDRALIDKISHTDDHMVIFGADGTDTHKIGAVKYKPPGIGLGSRSHGIKVKNKKEAMQVIAHLESDAVKRLVSVLKYTAKNSKSVFSRIPTHSNPTEWMSEFND